MAEQCEQANGGREWSMRGGKPRLMLVHAHPDDESSKAGATAARYASEGHDVVVVTCTGGEAGQVLNSAMDQPGVLAKLPQIRRQEMARAASVLGVRHRWLGFADSGMPSDDGQGSLPAGCFAAQPIDVPTASLVSVVRKFKPHVMVTYDEQGGYPHPDHVRCHDISVAAFDAAGDPDRFSSNGEPWQPLKLYYVHGFPHKRVQLFHDALLARGEISPSEQCRTEGDILQPQDPFDRVTTRVECSDFFGVRDDALRAHATQIDPNGAWFAVSLDVRRTLWPTEEYELARALVDTTLPETDLFAGLREHVRPTAPRLATRTATRTSRPETSRRLDWCGEAEDKAV